MKKVFFLPALLVLILANIFVYSCQKDNTAAVDPAPAVVDNIAVANREDPCCDCEFMIESVSVSPEPENILIYTTRAAGQCAGNVRLIDLWSGCNNGSNFSFNTWYPFNCCPVLNSNYTLNFRTWDTGAGGDYACTGGFTYPEVTAQMRIRCMGSSGWSTAFFAMIDPSGGTFASRNFQIQSNANGCFAYFPGG